MGHRCPIRTERDTIPCKSRKVSIVELIQVYATGIEIHQAPAIEQTDLDEAQLAPGGRKIPLLNNAAADATRILDTALAGGAVVVVDREVPTVLVGADQYQFQLTTEEVDITPAQVEDMPVEVTTPSGHIEREVVKAVSSSQNFPGRF